MKNGYEIIHLVRFPKGFAREITWDFKGPLPSLPECDVIVHLTAYVDFKSELNLEQYQVNTLGTLKLALLARSQNAYIVFASATGVQGVSGIIDEHILPHPNNGYIISKYLAEEITRSVVDRYTILRIAGIYGLDGPEHLGLNTAISNAFYEQRAPILKGLGKAKRNYIYVNDVARWVEYLVEQYGKEKNIPRLQYLAGPEVITIAQYLDCIDGMLLGGKGVVQQAGSDGNDMIVSGDKAPFELIKFKDYLQSLRGKMYLRLYK